MPSRIRRRTSFRALSQRDGRSPLEHALHDGEDHELLFTSHVEPSLGTRIGRIVQGSDVQIQRGGDIEILEARGWEHRL